METYDGTFFKPRIVEGGLAITGVAQDGDRTLLDSAIKPELDGAIKIVREKILVLVLLSGANYQ